MYIQWLWLKQHGYSRIWRNFKWTQELWIILWDCMLLLCKKSNNNTLHDWSSHMGCSASGPNIALAGSWNQMNEMVRITNQLQNPSTNISPLMINFFYDTPPDHPTRPATAHCLHKDNKKIIMICQNKLPIFTLENTSNTLAGQFVC